LGETQSNLSAVLRIGTYGEILTSWPRLRKPRTDMDDLAKKSALLGMVTSFADWVSPEGVSANPLLASMIAGHYEALLWLAEESDQPTIL
jgi:hypothetical protein